MQAPLGLSAVHRVEVLNRIGRPALRAGLAFALVLTALGCGLAFAAAMWRSALTGAAMPDMTAGAAPLLIALVPQVVDQFTRWRERQAEIAWRGAQGPRPADGAVG